MGLKGNPLVTAAAAIIIIAGMHAAAPLVNIILTAFLLAMSITPMMEWGIKKGVKPGLAVAMTITAVVVVGLLVSWIVGGSISSMIDLLPTYQPRLAEVWDSVIKTLAGMGIDMGSTELSRQLDPQRIVTLATGVLSAGLGVVSTSLVILLLMVFILIEAGGAIAHARRGEEVHGFMARYLRFGKDVRKYMVIVSLTGLIVAVANTALLLALGVDFALLWGVLSFFFNFIPSLGFIISLLPPALLALLAFGWEKALIVVIGFFLINSISENVIKTRFMAKGLDVSLLLVIVSLLLWTWTLGPMGTIIGVPLTLVLSGMYTEFVKEEKAGSPRSETPEKTTV
jgi:AI-2 transport protein TqsA